jgi:hypothetical protein
MKQIAEFVTGAVFRAGYLEACIKGPFKNGACHYLR